MNSLATPSTTEILDVCDILNRILQRAEALLDCVDLALQNPSQNPNPKVLCIALQLLAANLEPLDGCVDRLMAVASGEEDKVMPLAA